ncbi:MAG TPA: zinc-binding alcohol dehydrogenase family protein [Acidimicrobiales bacterium]|nr:zinc-binding alcohol dehydrogenase family protein [Acidimicrobiales bacterium]
MHAAVVHCFDRPPRYEEFATPEPGPGEILVEVLAAGLHPRVRSGANNSHYTSQGELPMIPGIDGVGRRPDGRLVFFVVGDSHLGTMAGYAVVDEKRSVELPTGLDPVVVAAAMNPAMSSWVALRRRIDFRPGQSVLVLGATGNAGQMAVQVAKRLGAGEVVAAGRDAGRLGVLAGLGADVLIALSGRTEEVQPRYAAAAEVDVVIDYLWGAPAEQAMTAVLTQRSDRSRPLSWIQIGAVAGPSIELPSQLLRAANFTLLGSGQGSVNTAGYLAEFPALLEDLAAGRLSVDARAVPLADVESVWVAPASPAERIVLVPGP